MHRNPMNGCSGLHLNPNSTLRLASESKIFYGNDSSVNREFFGKCTQNNIVHKAFLNELSSCN